MAKLARPRAIDNSRHLTHRIRGEIAPLRTLPAVQIEKLEEPHLCQGSKLVSFQLQAGSITVRLLSVNLRQTSTLGSKELIKVGAEYIVWKGQIDSDETTHHLRSKRMVEPSRKSLRTCCRVVPALQSDSSGSYIFRQHLFEHVQPTDAEWLDAASHLACSQSIPNIGRQRGALARIIQRFEWIVPFA